MFGRFSRTGRSRQRRGAVMIVVLSLLVLFTLIGVTFVIIASRYRRAAEAVGRSELKRDDPRDELEIAMYQLLRDVPDGSPSPLWRHSLLRDAFGSEFYRGEIQAGGSAAPSLPAPEGQGQLISFYCDFPDFALTPGAIGIPNFRDDHFAGSILTMTSGRARGLSARIVRYEAAPWNSQTEPWQLPANANAAGTRYPRLVVEAFTADSNSSSNPNDARTIAPEAGDQFLINGKPFNGTGYGFRLAGSNEDLGATIDLNNDPNDSTYQDLQVALLPRYSSYSPANAGQIRGDADEGYDAFDYHNMGLAYVPAGVTASNQIVPSYHRLALVNYWENRILGSSSPKTTANTNLFFDLMNHIVFRPMPWDHGNFDGGNSAATIAYVRAMGNDGQPGDANIDDNNNGIIDDPRELGTQGSDDDLTFIFNFLKQGSWDIDNDGDGIADSIWIDIEMPIKTTKEGRIYKPLFAFLIQDLDGRANLNAHGNLVHLEREFYEGTHRNSYAGGNGAPPATPYAINGARANEKVYLPRGRGVGPAEIHLQRLFAIRPFDFNNRFTPLTDNTEYEAILLGRYGADQVAGASGDGTLSAYKTLGVPSNYFNEVSSYLSQQPDRWGRGTVALDYNGQPVIAYASREASSYKERDDDPYEINLVEPDSTDSPFTPAEMERLLRFYDVDASLLPERLLELAPNTFRTGNDAKTKRGLVTTHSFDMPVPKRVRIPDIRVNIGGQELRMVNLLADPPGTRRQFGQHQVISPIAIGNNPPTIVDIIAARVFMTHLETKQSNDPPLTAGELRQHLRFMIPFEVRHGHKMDVNRLVGNGTDDNNNFIADEGGEGSNVGSVNHERLNTPSATVTTDLLNNYRTPFVHDDPIMARQMFARHLYCMMMFMLDDDYVLPFAERLDAPDPLTAQKTEFARHMTARRVAQWAINVVDFRDADAIMTPFEFDDNPYDGWQALIDGNPATDESDVGLGTADQRQIVWGCEFPDLLLTESLATHDRRVKDLKEDDGDAAKRLNDDEDEEEDDDLDQYRIPEASLFLELFCPRSSDRNGAPSQMRLPIELYSIDPNTGDYYLDLARTAGGSNWPVWQVAISEPHIGSNDEEKDPEDRRGVDTRRGESGIPDSISFQPENMRPIEQVLLPNRPADELVIERTIVFTTTRPTARGFAEAESSRYYYNRNPDVNRAANGLLPTTYGVKPGQYAVIGPRVRTHFGSALPSAMGMGMGMASDPVPSPQYIDLANMDITKVDGASTYPPLTDIQTPTVIVVGADRPNDWAAPNHSNPNTAPPNNTLPFIGVNISAPDTRSGAVFYDEPVVAAPGITPDGVRYFVDSYYDPDNPPQGVTGYPDEPFDTSGNSKPISEDAESDKNANGLLPTDTYENYRTAFLQRLANPLLPYDSMSNPYITIDWITLDLTVFNGEDNSTEFDDAVANEPSLNGLDFDPSDPGEYDDKQDKVHFRTRERGSDGPNPLDSNLFAQQWVHPIDPGNSTRDQSKPQSGEDPHFQQSLEHTLGYLNWETLVDNTGIANAMYDSSIGNRYKGSPTKPFPWLAWHDRPYANHLELLLAPASSPSRLLHEFNLTLATSTDFYGHSSRDPYFPPPPMGANPEAEINAKAGYFGHLLNFFHSSYENSGGATAPGANFYRIFEFVEVPSPFVGTERWYDPRDFQDDFADDSPGANQQRPIHALDRYRTPFNKLSRFRDPGKVNINTISSRDIWESIMKNFPAMDPRLDNSRSWNAFVQSRRGYSAAGLDPNYPTQIANPFRAESESTLVPITSGAANMKKPGVSTTLLRPVEDPSTNRQVPLFDNLKGFADINFDDGGVQIDYDYIAGAPVASIEPGPEVNSSRNAAFRYQALTRLGNMFSTNSNVYAVWITVGYFEVDPATGQLGQEVGSLTGEIKRHRAFYLIDRSVPVAFEPGENHNVDRAILIRRFIE